MQAKPKNYIFAALSTLLIVAYGLYILFNMNEINYLKIAGVILAIGTYAYIWIYIIKQKNKKNA